MDILDILIAKKKSFTGETEKLTRQANEAMAKANEVAAKLDEAEEALTAAQEAKTAAETANTRAQEIATDLESMKEEVTSAAGEIIDEKIAQSTSALQSAIDNAVTDVIVEDENTSSYKSKKAKVRKKGILNSFNIMKNYTSTGSNEDGSMTQKAITNALTNQKTDLENKINNIQISGGGSGNISGNISAEDEGSIVSIDENGNIIPSSITEADVILTQIISGTYKNNNIIGLELDYTNKTFTRLQGAKYLTAGQDFNKFKMYGGRKRCIVDREGNIEQFLTGEEDPETLVNKRIMVYQPAFYYLRVPLSVSKISSGFKINKEQLFLADQKYAGFILHPLFRNEEGQALRYVLLPAFESGTYRVNSDSYELNDSQNVDLENDCLVSIINAKPISGQSQEFTSLAAKRMCENNGEGWKMTNLEFESANQMLMMVEFGQPNIQTAFNAGITQLSVTSGLNYACNTGSTLSLGNNSGQAVATINIRNGNSTTYTTTGQCAISYRGMENSFGNMWRFIDGVSVINNIMTYKNKIIDFKLPSEENWINSFGYDENYLWIFLPIEASSSANSNLPIGDYYYPPILENVNYAGIIGGHSVSQSNAGIFYYSFNIKKDTFHYQHDTARVMYIPTPNTLIDNHNYNLWYEVV
jgi:hypothetical protein